MAINSVDEYFAKHKNWISELEALRKMILSTGLEETIKWSAPVYTVNGKNVVGLGAFKNHYGLWFFQGALLEENTKLLENAQEGKTKALRQIRFQKGDPVPLPELKKYVLEAKKNEEQGRKIRPEKHKLIEIPENLSLAFQNDKELEAAFQRLSPGCQREYCQYIDEARQEKTKEKRLAKIKPMILEKKGLNDKYKP